MTREEAINNIKELQDTYIKCRGEEDAIEVLIDSVDIEAFDVAIKALEQEPTTNNDLALIHTEGLDEEIRCTMCTNYMKSDRGCDGSCIVDKDMYKAVMDAIEKRIQPTTKKNLGVDCIDRAELLKAMDTWDKFGYTETGGKRW